MKTNRHVWSFNNRRKVIASAFSADHRSVIVLASIPGEEENEYHGATAVLWLDQLKLGR
jgi:hypothetical protein